MFGHHDFTEITSEKMPEQNVDGLPKIEKGHEGYHIETDSIGAEEHIPVEHKPSGRFDPVIVMERLDKTEKVSEKSTEVFKYWDTFFDEQFSNVYEDKKEVTVGDIKECLEKYFDDLKEKSECPEALPEKPFDVDDLKKISPEENAKMREEFVEKKEQLKREWEQANGRPWPKYDHDIYSANGKLIRKAGSDYDAHHIQPLGMGGKNEASNITPLNAEVHYDKQGVHAPDSPYSKLDKMLGGNNE